MPYAWLEGSAGVSSWASLVQIHARIDLPKRRLESHQHYPLALTHSCTRLSLTFSHLSHSLGDVVWRAARQAPDQEQQIRLPRGLGWGKPGNALCCALLRSAETGTDCTQPDRSTVALRVAMELFVLSGRWNAQMQESRCRRRCSECAATLGAWEAEDNSIT